MLRHLVASFRPARSHFNSAVRAAIEQEITRAESMHSGEICFVVESALGPAMLWRGVSGRQRALQIFAQHGVWDTRANNGVLIYVLLADHGVELVADRGLAVHVPEPEWRALCAEVEALYRNGDYQGGSITAIRGVARWLTVHFPPDGADRNELPNQPILL
jgi:uncharacterized membrane protein